MGELVHPKHSRGALYLPVDFFMGSSDTLIHTAAVSYLVLSVPVREGNDGHSCSNQGGVFYDPWIPLPKGMSTIVACSLGFSYATSVEANEYTPHPCFLYHRFVFLLLKATYQAVYFYWGGPPSMPMNFLVWWIQPAGCTAAFIVMVLFSDSTAAFLTIRSL